jgi:RNA polymerase sigma-70 factor (ECF subfamily)
MHAMLDETIDISLQNQVDTSALNLQIDDLASDGVLVAAVLSGDERAYAEIFERYRRPVARVIGKFFRDRSDIEELMQQSFTKAYFSLKGFHSKDDGSLGGWLSRIAINVCYDEFRRRRREASLQVLDPEKNDENHLDRMVAESQRSAEASLISRELSDRILGCLTAEDRIALTLVYSEEYSLSEAANAIGVSTSSLKSRLFRCRSELKRRFGYLFS